MPKQTPKPPVNDAGLYEVGYSRPKIQAVPLALNDFYASFSSYKQPAFTPEYGYKSFFFIFGSGDDPAIAKEQMNIAERIVSQRKDAKVTFYTEREKDAQAVKDWRETSPDLAERKNISVEKGNYTQEIWAQDIGETTGGDQSYYVKGWVPSFYGERANLRSTPYTDKQGAEMDVRTIRIPAVLQGGNFTKTMIDGKKVIIVGSNDIIYTKEEYKKRHNYFISADQVSDIYKTAFSADEVLILGGDEKQPTNVFHIDQAVFFPKEGTAVLMKPEGGRIPPDEKEAIDKMLTAYKKQLTAAGFDVVEIPTTYSHIREFEAYTNSIPITSEGRTTVIMPSYNDMKTEAKVKEILEKKGITVLFVENKTAPYQGNTHCITGTLSLNQIGSEEPGDQRLSA